MKSVTEEIKKYRYYALEASSAGNRTLAKQWRMAADQAYHFYLQNQWKERSFSHTQTNKKFDIPLRTLSFNYQVQAIRQEAYSILQASQACKQENHEVAEKFITMASSIREAAACYHEWIAKAKQGAYESFTDKITSSLEQAEQYRLQAFEATQINQLELAQYWAEAACLLQEAARKLKIARKTFGNNLRHLMTDYWRTAAHAAHYAASFQAEVAKLITLEHKELAAEWRKVALLADQAMVLKAKAAHIHRDNEFLSIDWSLAGYWMALAADIKVFLIKTTSQKIELPFWEKAFIAVENAANIYQKILYSLEETPSSQPYWEDLLASSQDAADRLILLAEREME